MRTPKVYISVFFCVFLSCQVKSQRLFLNEKGESEMLKMLEHDDCHVSFEGEEEMASFLKEMAAADKWENIPLNDFKLSVASQMKRDAIKAPEHIKDRIIEDNGFVLNKYPMSAWAFPTLCDRALNNAKILARLSKDDTVKMLNMSWPYMKPYQGSSILIRGHQILAVHTDKYMHLPQGELFSAFKSGLDEKFEAEYLEGYYDHELTSALYSVENKPGNPKILEVYRDAWIKAGFPIQTLAEAKPSIRFVTADNGRFCATAYSLLVQRGVVFNLGSVKVKHEAPSSINKYEESIKECFSILEVGLDALAKMMAIKVAYPVAALVRIAKKTALPKKAATEAIEMFKMTYIGDPVTAYELYYTLMECMNSEHIQGLRGESKLNLQESLARIINLDWSEIDKPGSEDL